MAEMNEKTGKNRKKYRCINTDVEKVNPCYKEKMTQGIQ